MRRHLAVVVALEVLAQTSVGAVELVVGAIDVTVAELRDVQAFAVRARQFVHRAALRAVQTRLLIGRIQQVELSDQPTVEDFIAQPTPGNAFPRVFAVEETGVVALGLYGRVLVAFFRFLIAAVVAVGRQVALPQKRDANAIGFACELELRTS